MVTLTGKAAKQLKQIMSKEGKDELALRVYVSPGGCSGFSYGMSLDDDRSDDDATFEYDGVTVLVDQFSLQYLEGAHVDYSDALMGGGFQVRNPNAVKACSCGQSFDTAASAGQPRPCS